MKRCVKVNSIIIGNSDFIVKKSKNVQVVSFKNQWLLAKPWTTLLAKYKVEWKLRFQEFVPYVSGTTYTFMVFFVCLSYQSF